MRHFFASIYERPLATALTGTASAFAAFDFLRAAQITAAVLASTLSICSLILVIPKVVAVIRSPFTRK